jgi:hypothetical protein
MKIPQSCSWTWRKLLKFREVARDFIASQLGMVITFSFGLLCGIRMEYLLGNMGLDLYMMLEVK